MYQGVDEQFGKYEQLELLVSICKELAKLPPETKP
jgi:hypothetical protein